MKDNKKLILLGFILFFIIIYGLCVIRINSKYPPATENIRTLNQTFEYQNIHMTITHFKFMNEDETATYYEAEIKNYGSCLGIHAEILLENTSDTTQTIDLTPLIFESGAWKNAVHYAAFIKLNAENEKMSLHPTLSPRETLSLILPSFVSGIHMRNKQWSAFPNRDIYLTFSLYPEKLMVKLQ